MTARAALALLAAAVLLPAGAAEAGKKGPNKRHPHKPAPAFPGPKKKPKAPKLPKLPATPALPQSADPLDQKLASRVFEVEITASRSVTWSTPAMSVGNCQGTTTTSAKGDEEWEVRTGSRYMRIVRVGDAYTFVHVPRKYHIEQPGPMPAGGTWSRSAEETVTHSGGWCGSGQPAKAPAKTDCGSRKPRYTIGLGVLRGKGLWLTFSETGDADFETCRVMMPQGMPSLPGAQQLAPFDPAEIIENQGGAVRFSQSYDGPGDTSGTLEFVVRLEERGRD